MPYVPCELGDKVEVTNLALGELVWMGWESKCYLFAVCEYEELTSFNEVAEVFCPSTK